MTRIKTIDRNSTDSATKELLDMVKKKMGSVPNTISTMANSIAVAKAYLGFNQALSSGTLSLRMREQIALLVGEFNECDYCLAAHTAFGLRVGLDNQEIFDARRGISGSQKEHVALEFVKKVVQKHGSVSDEEVERVREAGFSDGEIAEIVANIALNIFTNYFNLVAATEIDFPIVPRFAAA